MDKATMIAVDLAKNVFQVGFFDARGVEVEAQKRFKSRAAFERFLDGLAPPQTLVLEVGLGAQAWARRAQARGIEVRLLPAQRVAERRFGAKNDRNDVDAIMRTALDPKVHVVPVKTPEQLSLQALHRVRRGLIGRRTSVANQIRGLLIEHGIAIAKGAAALRHAMNRVLGDAGPPIPDLLREVLADSYAEWNALGERCERLDGQLVQLAAVDPVARRLDAIPGIGPITATALAVKAVELKRFKGPRAFAASFGLVPEQHSSGDRHRLGHMTRRGDRYIRSLLVSGAQAVIQRLPLRKDDSRHTQRLRRWVLRRGGKAAAIRLANHNLRVIYMLLTRNKDYAMN